MSKGSVLGCLLGILLLGLAACDRSVQSPDGLPTGNDVLYADSFTPETGGNWLLEGDELAQAVLVEERLLIEVEQPNTVHYATLTEQNFSDFFLTVEATQVAGSPDSSYGVLLRLSEQGFYRFEVTGSGLYMVERHSEDGSWTRLTDDWLPSPVLLQGLNNVNRLAVRASGSTFSFYANDTLLVQLADTTYSAGAVALDAGTFSQPGLQVAFDNLVIRQP